MSLTLAETVQLIVGDLKIFGVPCTVIEGTYNEETQTVDCAPIDGKADYLDVKLQAEVKPGLLYIPKDNSVVIVQQTSNDSAYVSMFGEVQEVVFLDGTHKGMVKVTELVEKINTLENDINTLKNLFATWVPTPNDGGLSLQVFTATWQGQTLTPTQISDLENEKVTH
jgi:hypothetical protein